MAQTFTTDLVRRAIKSCRNSKAFGPDKLSIIHLKNLGPRAIEYITALFNLSVTACLRYGSLHCSSQYRNLARTPPYELRISLLCPAAKVLESLIRSTINHPTTSAMLQMTTDIAMGFNQRKPPDRTICVAVDLSAALDTDCHNNLLSKINRSHLSPSTARWMSCI